MHKKIVISLLILVLAFSLCGCVKVTPAIITTTDTYTTTDTTTTTVVSEVTTTTTSILNSTITMTPESGINGTEVTITGTNFVEGVIDICIDGVMITTAEVNASGDFASTFEIFGYSYGTHIISAGNVATAFHIEPSLTISATSGHVGDTITLYGYGFNAHDLVTVKYDGVLIASGQMGADGSVANASFPIPSSDTFGNKTIRVTDGTNSLSVNFYVVSTGIMTTTQRTQ
jgi:hypothetical protein